MSRAETFRLSRSNECELLIERVFAAKVDRVFDAFTRPDLVRRWLLGPPGWTMPVCEIDLRVGGAYRYVWSKSGIPDMGMGGIYQSLTPGRMIIASEKFDEAWYPGEAIVTTSFIEQSDLTQVSMRVRYESSEACDLASSSGMEQGMAAGFDRLAQLLAGHSDA
jgi:uncharacterized protein YndB with AHSA1/START domain